MNRDFALFQKEFKKWQVRFGLTGYKIDFQHQPLGDCFADISIDQHEMIATVSLDSKSTGDVRVHAKHEAIHLLLGRIQDRAERRFVLDSEIYETVEELTRRLEGLIQ